MLNRKWVRTAGEITILRIPEKAAKYAYSLIVALGTLTLAALGLLYNDLNSRVTDLKTAQAALTKSHNDLNQFVALGVRTTPAGARDGKDGKDGKDFDAAPIRKDIAALQEALTVQARQSAAIETELTRQRHLAQEMERQSGAAMLAALSPINEKIKATEQSLGAVATERKAIEQRLRQTEGLLSALDTRQTDDRSTLAEHRQYRAALEQKIVQLERKIEAAERARTVIAAAPAPAPAPARAAPVQERCVVELAGNYRLYEGESKAPTVTLPVGTRVIPLQRDNVWVEVQTTENPGLSGWVNRMASPNWPCI